MTEASVTKDPIINKIAGWKRQSESLRSQYDHQWAKNLKLIMGVWDDEELSRSKVRNRSKIYFRKIWATRWRLLASYYSAFMRDPDTFKIEGRGPEDWMKAKVLQVMTEYRRDWMMSHDSLFLKMLWAGINIFDMGYSVVKFSWKYTPSYDGPCMKVYPNEQVYPDLSAETVEEMRYIIFENFMTKDDMEESGFENVDKAQPMSVPHNIVRSTRYSSQRDPMQNPGENEYPSPGTYEDDRKDNLSGQRYRVLECFYREKGRIMYCVTDGEGVFFKKPEPSAYRRYYPVIMGNCLTVPHRLIGEGFPEALEGPQKSFNHLLNLRKDNVALSLAPMKVINRFGNVDLQALLNSRPGGVVLADDVDAVRYDKVPDVTQSAYIEAAADDAMMQEMSGVTPTKQGMSGNIKATVAQIDLAEGNAKIDLFLAVIGETFVKRFYLLLANYIQMFETDDRVFRVANDRMNKEMGAPIAEVYDLDFEADCTVNVGAGTVGRQMEVQQAMLAMDRAIMANQASTALLASGAAPAGGVQMFNVAMFLGDFLPKLGYRDPQRYFVTIKPPPQPQEGSSSGQAGSMPAMSEGGMGDMSMMNELQAGGLGG